MNRSQAVASGEGDSARTHVAGKLRERTRIYGPLVLIAVVLGALCTACDMMLFLDHFEASPRYVFRFAIYALSLFFLFYAGDRLVGRMLARSESEPADRLEQSTDKPTDEPDSAMNGTRRLLDCGWTKRGFLASMAVIYICWLPYLFLTYPGVIWYDTQQQLAQFFHMPNVFGDGSHLSDHHPVLDTVIFGGFVRLGQVFGSGNNGLFLYALLMSLFTAAVLALTVLYLRRIGVPRRLCAVVLWFFALFPIFPMYSSAMVKDTVSLPFFVLFALCFVEAARTKGGFLRNPWALAAFVVCALLMALTKKTGMYVVVVACLFLPCFLPKGRRLRALLPAVVTALVMTIALPKVVFPAFGIEEGGKQEVLGIAFQQSARLLRDHPDDVSRQDTEVIHQVLGRDVADRYQWWATDSVKGYSWSEEQSEHVGEYMKVWAKGLVEHPLTYIKAYVALEQGWMGAPMTGSDGKTYNVAVVYAMGASHMFGEAGQWGLEVDSLDNIELVEDCTNWLADTFLGRVVFSRALWSTWLPIFVIYECLRRKRLRRRLSWLLPMASTFLFLWVSPTSVTVEGMRYMVPLIYIMPLSLAALFAVEKRES